MGAGILTPTRAFARLLPPPGDPKFNGLQDELGVLADSVDAVSDALMAEGMYHMVRGNPLRAATTVERYARPAAR